jgi:hypothetical protein
MRTKKIKGEHPEKNAKRKRKREGSSFKRSFGLSGDITGESNGKRLALPSVIEQNLMKLSKHLDNSLAFLSTLVDIQMSTLVDM